MRAVTTRISNTAAAAEYDETADAGRFSNPTAKQTATFPGFLSLGQADIFVVWLLLTVVNLAFHRLIPLDETRYASVAWEMWVSHDYLVPHLNGVPYHHKPPLLFWIDVLGWALFGVSERWLLLVSPLCGLASLYLVRYLAGRLWPDNRNAARKAPWLLLGSLIWGTFMNGSMFDMLLGLCVLAAMLGLVRAASVLAWRHWMLFALGCGLGLLAKGPVVFMHILPPYLLGRFWSQTARQSPAKWYGQGLTALLAGCAIGLAWAIPAVLNAGDGFGGTLLWHQTANRVVNSFAHRRPVWWYLELAPVILFPWCFWPRFWQSISRRALYAEPSVRFCAIWLAAGSLGFSAISGKQVHYLLPLMPALALLMSRALTATAPADLRAGDFLPFIVICLAGVALLVLPGLDGLRLYNWINNRVVWWPVLIIATGIAGILLKIRTRRLTPYSLSAATIIFIAAGLAGFFTSTGNAFHLNDAASELRHYQDAGEPVAWIGKYDGQFLFLLRRDKPMRVIQPNEAARWLNENPNGHVISISATANPLPGKIGLKTDYLQPYREDWLVVQSLDRQPSIDGSPAIPPRTTRPATGTEAENRVNRPASGE